MEVFAEDVEMVEELPFHRFDVVDREFHVISRGATLESLAFAGDLRLEPAIEREVRQLLREQAAHGAHGAGLLGLDYVVHVDPRPEEPGTYVVCLERVSIRAAIESFAERFALDRDEFELARLLIGGYADAAIAWRLGCSLGAAVAGVRALLRKTQFATREMLIQSIYARKRGIRHSAAVAARRLHARPA